MLRGVEYSTASAALVQQAIDTDVDEVLEAGWVVGAVVLVQFAIAGTACQTVGP